MNKDVAHLTYDRATRGPEAKTWDLAAVVQTFREVMSAFAREVQPEHVDAEFWRAWAQPSRTPPKPDRQTDVPAASPWPAGVVPATTLANTISVRIAPQRQADDIGARSPGTPDSLGGGRRIGRRNAPRLRYRNMGRSKPPFTPSPQTITARDATGATRTVDIGDIVEWESPRGDGSGPLDIDVEQDDGSVVTMRANVTANFLLAHGLTARLRRQAERAVPQP